jgi:hypothetical protein
MAIKHMVCSTSHIYVELSNLIVSFQESCCYCQHALKRISFHFDAGNITANVLLKVISNVIPV